MRIALTLCWIALLAICHGCGMERKAQDDPRAADNFGDGFSFDEQSTVTGIRLRFGGPGSVHIDEVDRVYLWIADRMLVSPAPTPGPLVVFKLHDEIIGDDGQSHDGIYRQATDTMVINDSLVAPNLDPIIDPLNGAPLVDRVICHESVHRILSITTGDADHDHVHKQYFDYCSNVFL